MSPTALPPLSPALTGVESGPLTQVIEARWTMAYAAAAGTRHPRYFDTTAAGGPAVHPLFAVCYEWPLLVALRATVLGEALARRSVHATHRLAVHRPPRPGEAVTTSARVTGVTPRRAGTLLGVRLTTLDAAGAPVTTTDYGTLLRGVAVEGTPAASPGRAAPASVPPWEPRWSERVEVAAHAAHVYTECARIWNPIHTDLAVARAAGLPGPILHGTATLALALSLIVERDLGDEPARVREVTVRFSGMVPLPSALTVRSGPWAQGVLRFDAVGAGGEPVLSEGAITT